MKRLFAIVVTGAALAATPAIAGSSLWDELNNCVSGPDTIAGCLQDLHLGLSEARAKRVAACMLRHGSDGKSVTRKQWVTCGLPKEETKV
jgi:hypothetical protein